jgi:hypothetical protein
MRLASSTNELREVMGAQSIFDGVVYIGESKGAKQIRSFFP